MEHDEAASELADMRAALQNFGDELFSSFAPDALHVSADETSQIVSSPLPTGASVQPSQCVRVPPVGGLTRRCEWAARGDAAVTNIAAARLDFVAE